MTGSEREALIEEIGERELAGYILVRCDRCMYWEIALSSPWFIGHCPCITQEVFDGLSISRKRIPIYTRADSSCEFFAPSDDEIDDAISEWQDEQAIRESVEKQPQNYID